MTATAWAIKDWDRAFETWQTRRIKKGLEYIKVPAGRQCRAYKLLMAEPDGALIYGVFVALCQFAASRQCRGLLADPDRELSVAELGVEVLCNPTAVSRAIEVLASPAIGWLVRTDIPTDGRHIWDRDPHTTDDDRRAHQSASDDRRAHQSASDLAHITKQNKTEQNKTNTPPTPPQSRGAKAGGGDSPSLQEIQKAWPAMPIPTAKAIHRLRLSVDDLNELDQAADAIKPPLRDKSAWLLVRAKEYAHDRRKPPPDGPGASGHSGDRTAEAISGGAA